MIALALLLTALQSCPGGVCQPPAETPPAQVVQVRHWQKIADNELNLIDGSRAVGHFNFLTQEYRPYDGKKFGEVQYKTPIPLPDGWEKVGAKDDQWKFEGVQAEKIAKAPQFVCNGKECTKAEALAAIEKDTLPDDSGKLLLTLIGKTQPEADGMKAAVAGKVGDGVLINAYASDSPMLAGFVTDPGTVYIQDHTGKVIHRGLFAVDNVVSAVRAARPDYDPKKDPNLNLPLKLPGLPDLGLDALLAFVKEHMLTLIVIGIIVYFCIKAGKKA